MEIKLEIGEQHYLGVESSHIEKIYYDKNTLSLIIKFKGDNELNIGSEYLYAGVPPSVYDKFLNAESKGEFLKQKLNAYPYIRIK